MSTLDDLQEDAHKWALVVNDGRSGVALRARRFIEEAVELVQACGIDRDQVNVIIDYVYNRPVGDVGQEVGGVGMTLLPLCQTLGLSAAVEFYREFDRISQPEVLAKIRAKQTTKAEAGI